MKTEKNLRETSHYNVFRIGADTDIFNGRIRVVQDLLEKLEEKGDYIACQAIFDSLEIYNAANIRAEN
ncbi:hypothetical protein [Rubrolithibacter danxiaensis]|uniref:hypothetical protein n=1 Tax=Rubrolithibacter danxiaensis TaxID=3390805 RepID=UPI003BF8483B